MKNPTPLARTICKAAGWNADLVSEARYILLLEETIRQAEETLDKAAAKLDDAGVKDLRKRLAFPEGTVAVLPQEGDLVVQLRGLSDFEKARLVKSYGNKVVGTSEQGLARVTRSGEIDPASVQGQDQLEAVDRLIQMTALAVEKRQANPEDVQGKTAVHWRLT
jgi:hypothetical protein